MRARPDEGHIASDDVPELWQLIQAGLAQPSSHTGYARVSSLRLRHAAGIGCFNEHRPEFQDFKAAAVGSVAALTEEHRPRRGQLDRKRDRAQAGREQGQQERGDNNIEAALQLQLSFNVDCCRGLAWRRMDTRRRYGDAGPRGLSPENAAPPNIARAVLPLRLLLPGTPPARERQRHRSLSHRVLNSNCMFRIGASARVAMQLTEPLKRGANGRSRRAKTSFIERIFGG